MGNFQTEKGFYKVRLHTIFGESNILKGVNLTEIQKGYNLVDFEINRLICSNFQAKLSQTSCERERKLKHHVLKEIEPIMQKIIQQGLVAPADLQNGFCRRSMQLANLWRVK